MLVFEGNQVINFLKMYKRYGRQENVTLNKMGKKGDFSSTKKKMEEAVGNFILSQLTVCPFSPVKK